MEHIEKLLSSYRLNQELTLKNRIVMSPMTRARAQADGSVTAEMADYYSRRAGAGLIMTEGTIIRPDAKGFNHVPAIYNADHVRSWRQVTQAVHAHGGKIFSQLWHVGRVSHPEFLEGKLPIAPSATVMSGSIPRSRELQYGRSRAVTKPEIEALVLDFKNAAKNALEAGFDGVEVHGANGFLIDQFLHYDTNQRMDEYGGTPENMARFALEVVRACGEVFGYERVGLRLSPGAYLNEIKGDMRDQYVFKYLLEQLNELPIAFVHTGNYDDQVLFPELNNLSMTAFMRLHYRGHLIASGSYNQVSAFQGIENKVFDLIAFGRPFIANPDLIERLRDQRTWRAYHADMLNVLY